MDDLARGRQRLDDLVASLGGGARAVNPAVLGLARTAMSSTVLSVGYALLAQSLAKALHPDIDARVVSGETWPGASPRTLCKELIVPLNQRLGGPLKESADPYVSNPLRGDPIGSEAWRARRRPADLEKWQPTLDLLDRIEASSDSAEAADEVLAAALKALLDRSPR